jgi:hypothetical protein
MAAGGQMQCRVRTYRQRRCSTGGMYMRLSTVVSSTDHAMLSPALSHIIEQSKHMHGCVGRLYRLIRPLCLRIVCLCHHRCLAGINLNVTGTQQQRPPLCLNLW